MVKKKRGHGEGTIYQTPSGSWRAQIWINAERVGRTVEAKADGIAWLADIQSKRAKGYDVAGRKQLLGAYMDEWLDTKEPAVSPRTICQYRQIVRDYVTPELGEIPLKDLRLQRIEQHYSMLQKRGVGTRTIRLTHAVLHRALEKAVKYAYLHRNPASGASLPKRRAREMKTLNAEQVTQFLIAARDGRHEVLYHLAIQTGMRQGELLGLQWRDVDWVQHTIRVQRQVKWVPGESWRFVDPKTRAGFRTILLSLGLLDTLKRHKQSQAHETSCAGKRWQDHDLICPTSVGTPPTPSNLRKDFNRVLERAGVPRIRFHDLRHTAASLMLNGGIPPIVVSKILGHAQPSITLDIYGHVYAQMQMGAAEVMDDLVAPIPIDLDGLSIDPTRMARDH